MNDLEKKYIGIYVFCTEQKEKGVSGSLRGVHKVQGGGQHIVSWA